MCSETHPAIADVTVSKQIRMYYLFRAGWELRPKRGERMTLNTVTEYRGHLTEFYASGAPEKGRKMAAA